MVQKTRTDVKRHMNEIVQEIVAWSQNHLGIGSQRLTDIVLTLVLWSLLLVARFAITHIVDRRVADVQRRYALTKTLHYVLGFIFFAAATVIWFGGLTGWSAYLGLVSAGLAIALQDPLVNLAGWIFISVRRPFSVGDRIEIGGHRGDVGDHQPLVDVQATVVPQQVAAGSDGQGHHRHPRVRQVGQHRGDVATAVHGRDRADHPVPLAGGPGGDQRVQVLLVRQFGSGPRGASREGGDPPVGGIVGAVGVPGLMGAEEVAEPHVHHPDGRRRTSIDRPGQSTGHCVPAFPGESPDFEVEPAETRESRQARPVIDLHSPTAAVRDLGPAGPDAANTPTGRRSAQRQESVSSSRPVRCR